MSITITGKEEFKTPFTSKTPPKRNSLITTTSSVANSSLSKPIEPLRCLFLQV